MRISVEIKILACHEVREQALTPNNLAHESDDSSINILTCRRGNATGMQPHGTYIYKDGRSAWLREARVKEEKTTELIYIKMDGARGYDLFWGSSKLRGQGPGLARQDRTWTKPRFARYKSQ